MDTPHPQYGQEFQSARRSLAPILVLVLALHTPAAIADNEQETTPIESGLIERTGVSLLLVDVVATDKNGKPIPGLDKADFTITLDGRLWEIHSLDDLCSPDQLSAAEKAVTDSSPTARASEKIGVEIISKTEPEAQDSVSFALYFDFSQLRQEGRVRAVDAAKQWVREVMQAGTEAKVVAYGYNVGLREFSPFTADKQMLLSAIDEADTDPELLDSFPMGLPDRIEACCIKCGHYETPPLLLPPVLPDE